MGASLKERLPSTHVAPCEGGEIYLYATGGLSMSVCAPGELSGEKVAAAVERHYRCGTDRGWTVATDTFKTGERNPCVCQEDPHRKHWLLYA